MAPKPRLLRARPKPGTHTDASTFSIEGRASRGCNRAEGRDQQQRAHRQQRGDRGDGAEAEIEAELAALGELRDKPAGTIRITATDYAANTLVWPKLAQALRPYPDIKVEVCADYALTDIVAARFDIGVRWGDMVAKDMIAVRIGPDRRMVVAGAPSYLSRRQRPATPQQLVDHDCINLRLPTSGGLLAWELRQGEREMQVRVEGQFTFSNVFQTRDAALAGYGLAYVPEDLALPHVQQGTLQLVLEDWSPTFTGHHAYYPSRRHSSRALQLVIEALRHRA
jgi:DNA-binding transcriptional LysR family regulator